MTRFAICMISTHFYPKAGGAEKQIERLAGWLVQHDIPVMVVTRRFDRKLPARETLSGVEIFRIPVLPGKVGAALSFGVGGILVLLRHRQRFNVVHSHQIFSPTTLGWLATRVLRYPLIVNLHGGGPKGDLARLLRHRRGGRIRLAGLKRSAAAFIAVSQEIEQELLAQGIPAAQIRLMNNSVDPAVFCPVDAETRTMLRRALELPVESPLVTFVGRLVDSKGLEVLFDAWAQVPPPAHLVIVGTGTLASELRRRAAALKGRVTFAGQTHDVVQYLQASDAWTLPSLSEGLPLSLLEAMSCALPVVATSVGAIPQVVQSGLNGLTVAPGDPAALAEALCQALDRRGAARAMGQRARQTVLDYYSLEAAGQKYLSFLEELLHPDESSNG